MNQHKQIALQFLLKVIQAIIISIL